MRNLHVRLVVMLLVALAANSLASRAWAARIEADPNRTYTLTKQHGPWMIMVATFHTSLRGEEEQQLKNAENAAHELVYELRKKGIPAYVYQQSGALGEVDSHDRFGERQTRYMALQRNGICVLAGNYGSIDDDVAQKTLTYVKQLHPKSLKNGVYKSTPGRPGPLSRAFLTLNPMLSEPEIVERTRKRDPLLIQLNAGADYSLTENPGNYSLVVASFHGKKQTTLSNTVKQATFQKFDEQLKTGSRLDQAAVDAWELTKTMRAQGFEAYVYHDRYRSIVTVGSFTAPDDPRVRTMMQNFAAKRKQHPQTGNEVLVCESIQIKGNDPNKPPLRLWILDPVPQLMATPRLK